MSRTSLMLLGVLLLGTVAGLAEAASPAGAAPADEPATETAEPTDAAPATPVFLGILKEGQKLPTARETYEAEKAKRDQAGLEEALNASKDLAIRIGSFAVKLMIGIAIAATTGACIAAIVVFFRGRRRNLMAGKAAQSGGKSG